MSDLHEQGDVRPPQAAARLAFSTQQTSSLRLLCDRETIRSGRRAPYRRRAAMLFRPPRQWLQWRRKKLVPHLRLKFCRRQTSATTIRHSGREWFVPFINFPVTAKSADHRKIATITEIARMQVERLPIENWPPRRCGFQFRRFLAILAILAMISAPAPVHHLRHVFAVRRHILFVFHQFALESGTR